MLNDRPLQGLRLSNTLIPCPEAAAQVAGHLLRHIYADLIDAEQPELFKSLILQLEAREMIGRARTGSECPQTAGPA
ncbi:hypothetical protein [Microvirga pudoricolor]|uniref:hypothetical protein n=1 Tax=Microvirga pudoricolor TaxID=2778729 RepID=UPI001950C3B3|nr:hypothetical protein [Microvirga pudoricolor]MBM6595648.1 hypothetical protein [Microvirga pudoricolor]